MGMTLTLDLTDLAMALQSFITANTRQADELARRAHRSHSTHVITQCTLEELRLRAVIDQLMDELDEVHAEISATSPDYVDRRILSRHADTSLR